VTDEYRDDADDELTDRRLEDLRYALDQYRGQENPLTLDELRPPMSERALQRLRWCAGLLRWADGWDYGVPFGGQVDMLPTMNLAASREAQQALLDEVHHLRTMRDQQDPGEDDGLTAIERLRATIDADPDSRARVERMKDQMRAEIEMEVREDDLLDGLTALEHEARDAVLDDRDREFFARTARAAYDEIRQLRHLRQRTWADHLDRPLDLAATFAAEGHPYAELDDDDNIVIRRPTPGDDPVGSWLCPGIECGHPLADHIVTVTDDILVCQVEGCTCSTVPVQPELRELRTADLARALRDHAERYMDQWDGFTLETTSGPVWVLISRQQPDGVPHWVPLPHQDDDE
jgi:hypothetical protein